MSNPTLNVCTQTIHSVDYCDLEEFVQQVYGRQFDVVADMECSNDTTHEFTVEAGEISSYGQGKLDKWKDGGYSSYLTDTILTDLCNRGLIEPGEYLIKVSW